MQTAALISFFIFASVLLPCFLFRLALTAHSSLVDVFGPVLAA